jgi:tellurite resistance protein TerA
MTEHEPEPASQPPEREVGHPIILAGAGAASGTLRINHHWDVLPPGRPGGHRSLLRKLFPPMQIEADAPILQPMIDLDLGCFYELTNGARGFVQAKGNQRGDFNRPPYITHGSDDRYGSAAGENLFVNLDYASRFRRILIYVYRYPLVTGLSGQLNPARGTVTFFPSIGGPVEVELLFTEPDIRTCAVALLMHSTDGQLVARRDLRYIGGYHDELDALYSWSLQPGSTRPVSPGD